MAPAAPIPASPHWNPELVWSTDGSSTSGEAYPPELASVWKFEGSAYVTLRDVGTGREMYPAELASDWKFEGSA